MFQKVLVLAAVGFLALKVMRKLRPEGNLDLARRLQREHPAIDELAHSRGIRPFRGRSAPRAYTGGWWQ